MSANQLKSALWCVLFWVGMAGLLTLLSHQPWPVTAQDDHTFYLPLVTRPIIFTRGNNLLLNPSFEGEGDCQINPPNPDVCWYHPGGIPELQIPIRWVFDYENQWDGRDCGQPPVCDNPLTPEPDDWWNAWIRPEVRVVPTQLLPPAEHPLFIWDGNNTLKVFKGYGSISYAFTQSVWLEPGKYVLEMSVFPDLVVGYDDEGNKIWAPDPLSGEVKFSAGSNASDWVLPTFGQKNTYYYVFHNSQAQTVTMGVALRGRYAIRNNGWFMDDWWLWRQDDLTLPPGVYTRSGQPAILAANVAPPAIPYTFPAGNPTVGADE
ncbi:MAG: hypothetical protein HS099_28470 [Ardenticatenaceae bacterium]|nr:hypothetical protein [Ardenticatenaceae bacterium]